MRLRYGRMLTGLDMSLCVCIDRLLCFAAALALHSSLAALFLTCTFI